MNARARLLVSACVLFSSNALAQNHARSASAASVVPATSAPDPTPADKATKLRDDGNAAMIGRRYFDALDDYQKALDLNPSDAGIFYNIARARQFLGDYPGALSALESFDQRASAETRAKVGKLDDLYAEIRPRVATLHLTCSEAGARVLVRERVVGATPLAATRLTAGASTVQIELDGFFTETRNVVLPGGGALDLAVTLQRKSTSGLLGVTSDPFGASVAVDGRTVGTTNPRLELALVAGAHDVLVRHEGYDDATIPLVLAPGATRDLSVPLERSRSILTRWYFWTGVGVVVLGGVALGYALTTEKSAGHGTLGSGQVGGP